MLTRMMAMLVVCALAVAAGCREQEPTPPYNRNLSTSESGRQLLPIARTVAGSRDPSITENARATIIRRDEMDTPEAAEMVQGEPTEAPEDLTTADSPQEALANVGKAFLGNLMGKTIPPVEGATETAGDGVPAADAGEASGEAEKEVRSIFGEFANEWAAGRYTRLASFCASGQESEAEYYYDTLDEMNSSLSSLLAAYEKSTPGVKSKFEQMLSQKRAAPTVTGVTIAGPDATLAVTGADGSETQVVMTREDGNWRIKNALFADSGSWPTLKSALEAHVVSIDDEVDELSGEDAEADSSKLEKLIEEAIKYLSALP